MEKNPLEVKIAQTAIKNILTMQRHIGISIIDSTGMILFESDNQEKILEVMQQADGDCILNVCAQNSGYLIGRMTFVWGNGEDSIQDYSRSLARTLAPALAIRNVL